MCRTTCDRRGSIRRRVRRIMLRGHRFTVERTRSTRCSGWSLRRSRCRADAAVTKPAISRSLLVVIDDTAECDRAVYFASRRAARIGGNVVMLRVIEMHDQSQQWLGVADIMRAEAHDEADAQLCKYAARANGVAGITPERVVREGDKAEEILRPDRRGRGHFHPRLGRRHRIRRGRGRWSPRSAGPPATIRSRSRSCPATSATRKSTRCRETSDFRALPAGEIAEPAALEVSA